MAASVHKPSGGVLQKIFLKKFAKFTKKTSALESIFNRFSKQDVAYMRVLQNLLEQIFYRTPLGDWASKLRYAKKSLLESRDSKHFG